MKYEIYFNGKKISMQWISENYGTIYAEELKEEIENAKPFDTITDASGMLEVFTW